MGNTGEEFPAVCPICGKRDAHIYFHRHREHRGGSWVWCGECYSFSHCSDAISEWWSNLIGIEEGLLVDEPDYLNENSKEIDRWVNAVVRRSPDGGKIASDVKCEKCGAVMRSLGEGDGGMGRSCDGCGWGWVTTWFEPMVADDTVYTLKVYKIPKPDVEKLRVISKVFGGNYLFIKKRIESGDMTVDGNARSIKEYAEWLRENAVEFEIQPPFPYPFRNCREHATVRLISEFRGLPVGTVGVIVNSRSLSEVDVEFFGENGNSLCVLTTPSDVLELIKRYE